MKKINAFQFGFATGTTGLIFYIFMVLLTLASQQTVISGMNLLFHGFDFSHLLQNHAPFGINDFLGAMLVFSLFFLFGSIVAGIYNYVLKEA